MFKLSPNIAINVSHSELAAKFYQDTFGFECIKSHTTPNRGIEMKSGATSFWIDQGSKPEDTGKVFFEFYVEDLEKAKAKLLEVGCKSLYLTTTTSHIGEMFKDPYGLNFHLYEKKGETI